MPATLALEDVLDIAQLGVQKINGHHIYVDHEGDFQNVKEPVRSSFNSRAKTYDDDSHGVNWRGGEIVADMHAQYRQTIPKRFQPTSGASVIKIFEVGSANGFSVTNLREDLKAQGLEPVVFGSDIAENMLVEGEELGRLNYSVQACADILRFAKPNSIDLINAIGMTQYVDEKGLSNFFKHAKQALVNDGAINISWSLPDSAGLKNDRRYENEKIIELARANGLNISGSVRIEEKAWQFWKKDPETGEKPYVANGFATFHIPTNTR